MRNLLFFLWMMFFPIVGDDVSQWIRHKANLKPTERENWVDVFFLITYIIVGISLYETA